MSSTGVERRTPATVVIGKIALEFPIYLFAIGGTREEGFLQSTKDLWKAQKSQDDEVDREEV
jgi:hypothetical protein